MKGRKLSKEWLAKLVASRKLSYKPKVIEFNGQVKSLLEWAKVVGIKPETLRKRINTMKWSLSRALTEYACKGRTGPKKGWHHTLEARNKIGLANKREKNNNWNGGITRLSGIIRSSFEYGLWRKSIFMRDGYRCVLCLDNTGGNLEADHIKPLAIITRENNIKTFDDAKVCDELWDINNGRTLCKKCHENTDTYRFKALNYVRSQDTI